MRFLPATNNFWKNAPRRRCRCGPLPSNASLTMPREGAPFLRGFRFFDQGFLADDDDDTGIGDVEAALVGFQVEADLGALGKADVAVDDGATDARVAADVHVVVDDGIQDIAVTVDTDVVADDGFLNAAAGDDGTSGDDGIESDPHALGIGKDKLGWRILVLPGTERPVLVIKIEHRRDADEVHVGFVVGVEGADVAPVEGVLGVFIDEVVGKDAVLRNDARKNVLAEVVAGLGILGVRKKDGNQQVRIEDVNSHRGIAVARVVRRLFGDGRLFLEADDSPILVGLNHTELLRGLEGGYFDGCHGDLRAGVAVLLEHAAVIHFVDVIPGEDEDEFGALAADGVDVLVDGVGGALIPLLRDAHLRREDLDVIAEAGEGRPAGADVAVQAEGLVLGEDENAAEIRIDAVREGDVDDAVERAERNGRLGAVASERPEAFALAPGKEYYDGIPHIGHWLPPAARIEKRPILTIVVGKKTSAAGSKPVRRTGERRGLVGEHSGPSSWKCLLFILALRECQDGYEIGSVPRKAVRKCKDSLTCMAGID